MEQDTGMKTILVVFIFIIVAAVLISAIGDSVNEVTGTWTNTNETLDFDASRVQTGGEVDINDTHQINISTVNNFLDLSGITLNNGTALVEDTDFNHTNTKITFLNSSLLADPDGGQYLTNLTNVTYTYNPDDYVKDSTSRVLLNLLTLFFAIGIILYVIARVMGAYGYDIMELTKLGKK